VGANADPDGFPRLLAEGLIDDRVNIVHGKASIFGPCADRRRRRTVTV